MVASAHTLSDLSFFIRQFGPMHARTQACHPLPPFLGFVRRTQCRVKHLNLMNSIDLRRDQLASFVPLFSAVFSVAMFCHDVHQDSAFSTRPLTPPLPHCGAQLPTPPTSPTVNLSVRRQTLPADHSPLATRNRPCHQPRSLISATGNRVPRHVPLATTRGHSTKPRWLSFVRFPSSLSDAIRTTTEACSAGPTHVPDLS